MSDESTFEAPQPSEMGMLRVEMRSGFQSVAKRFDESDKGFDGIDKRLDGVDTRLGGHDKRFDEVDGLLVTMDARITDEAAVTRRHFDVVAAGLRESFKAVIDTTTATGEKVDRLIASNAIEHAAFLDAFTDHEVRITRLEAAPGHITADHNIAVQPATPTPRLSRLDRPVLAERRAIYGFATRAFTRPSAPRAASLDAGPNRPAVASRAAATS